MSAAPGAEDAQCTICLDASTQPARAVPCGHIFCKDCLLQWATRAERRTCALCRAPVRGYRLLADTQNALHSLPASSVSFGQITDMMNAEAAVEAALRNISPVLRGVHYLLVRTFPRRTNEQLGGMLRSVTCDITRALKHLEVVPGAAVEALQQPGLLQGDSDAAEYQEYLAAATRNLQAVQGLAQTLGNRERLWAQIPRSQLHATATQVADWASASAQLTQVASKLCAHTVEFAEHVFALDPRATNPDTVRQDLDAGMRGARNNRGAVGRGVRRAVEEAAAGAAAEAEKAEEAGAAAAEAAASSESQSQPGSRQAGVARWCTVSLVWVGALLIVLLAVMVWCRRT